MEDRVLQHMGAQLEHRGPDAGGVKSFGGAGLAHRRLKILDLTDAAAQPMGNSGVWISFNGEIYNFASLREELAAAGHRFTSTGDTEVILHLYLAHGAEAIGRLDGMFALAIWDDRTKTLLLARDRTGKKPLYVYDDGKKVVFGSEIKAILAHPEIDDSRWPGAMPLYLTYGYVPTPRTMYEHIRKLPPATFQQFSLGETVAPAAKSYWDFPVAGVPETGPIASVEEAVSTIRTLFTSAVKRRMVADVPLGAFLSGGVDSTLVVGVMSQLSSRPIKTFSIGFEGAPDHDETAFARIAAARFGTDHTEFRVKPESFDLIEKLAWHYDEPFGDSSAIPTYLVSKLTRAHVTVALTGDGGDEVFAGYTRFYAAQLAESLPRPLLRALRTMAGPIPGGDDFRGLVNRGKRFLDRASEDLSDRFRGWNSFFSPDELAALLSPDLRTHATPERLSESYVEALGRCGGADLVNRLLYLNARTYLLDDLNVKVDRASMAVSLEARAPFLDTALMDYAFRLRGDLKLRGRTSKWILKKAFADLLPSEITQRPKMGFGVPLGAWFRGELKGWLGDRLLDPGSPIYPLLQRPFVERMFAEHQSRRRDWGGHFWVLAMLEIFLRRR